MPGPGGRLQSHGSYSRFNSFLPEINVRVDKRANFCQNATQLLRSRQKVQSGCLRVSCSKAGEQDSRTFIQSCMWFLHDGTGQTLCCLAHGELAWLFLEPDTGLDHCPRILLQRFRARTSASNRYLFALLTSSPEILPHILARSAVTLQEMITATLQSQLLSILRL